jgi:sugar/nucleoside kinase (ribokinase family)
MNQVFIYGEIGLDNIILVPFFPSPGKDAGVISDSYEVGGAASNVAVFLAHWEIDVGLSGNFLGDDFYGLEMMKFLKQHPHLDLSNIKIKPGLQSPFCRIIVRPDGDRSILFYNAQHMEMTSPHPGMFENVKIVALDLNGPERVETAELALRQKCVTVVGDVMRLDHPILPYCRIITNSAALIRHQYPETNILKHARSLHNASGSAIITTDGKKPVHVLTPEGDEFWVKPPEVKVIDTTGAGDALKAGIIYGLVKNWTWEKTVSWGVASGTANIQRKGAASIPPSIQDINNLIQLVEVFRS